MTGWRKHFRREFSHLQTFINEEKYHMNITFDENIWQKYKRSTLHCRGRSPLPPRRRITWRCSAAASRGEPHSEIFCYVKFCDYSRWNNEPQHYHHYCHLQVPPLQRAGGQHHVRRHHRRLHQEVPGQDVR